MFHYINSGFCSCAHFCVSLPLLIFYHVNKYQVFTLVRCFMTVIFTCHMTPSCSKTVDQYDTVNIISCEILFIQIRLI